jgi:hypothetical protein
MKLKRWRVELVVTDDYGSNQPPYTKEGVKALVEGQCTNLPSGIDIEVTTVDNALHDVPKPPAHDQPVGQVVIYSAHKAGITLPPGTIVLSDDVFQQLLQEANPTLTLSPALAVQ